jgi:diguanylate cyclase (GGDEF)-like protein
VVADKHHLATHDELTGTLNRRAIVAGGEREVAVAARLRRPLAVAYVDIDRFKQINDSYGHDAGDHVLRDVAELLKKTCRGIDLVGRYGGDEFCIVFPGTDSESIAYLGERLVKAVQQHRFRHGHPVTVSIGMAAISQVSNAATWDSLIQLADNALYAAKAGGRDRLCVAAALSTA